MATKYAARWKGDTVGSRGKLMRLTGVSQFMGYHPATDMQRNGSRGRFQQIDVYEPDYTDRMKRDLLRMAGVRNPGRGDF